MRKLTTEEFISKAKARWGDRFDYSCTNYIGRREQVDIVCPIHGKQSVMPDYFLYGKDCVGCSECGKGGGRRLTSEEWVNRAKKKWGTSFDYSRINYINATTRVLIGCPVHGWVSVLPDSHLMNRESNKGCPRCGQEQSIRIRRFTFDDFLTRARLKYGDRYDYDKDSFTGSTGSISFVCSVHGNQKQRAESFLNNRSGNLGCKWCSKRAMGDRQRVSFLEFLRRARQVHGDLYGYSDERYFGLNNEAGIDCKEHGLFWQSAKNHVDLAHGCSACSGKKQHTSESWIEKARLVHGDRYSYELVDYRTAHDQVIITCPTHGDFQQLASDHTNKGHGCPTCGRMLNGNDNLSEFRANTEKADAECELYVVNIKGFVKIGISKDSANRDASYEEFLYQRLTTRATAWCVEQYILQGTRWAIPSSLPIDLDNWAGKSELRCSGFIPLDELANLIDEELDDCELEGWHAYATRKLLAIDFW